MNLAFVYPLLAVFWTMLEFFLFVAWVIVLFYVFADIFRSHHMGGFAKAGWFLLVIFVPLFGVFIYLVASHGSDADAADAAYLDAQTRV
jgi:hypothetical protein